MNKAQKLFVDQSLMVAISLAWISWTVVIILGVGAPFPAESDSLRGLIEEILVLDRSLVLEVTKLLGVCLWGWLCFYVRLGRRK
ncbi:hypothetical protein [Pseudomonas sp. LFM046]|uniref:hypothetical protein n=1 Tax=Pseudomonas sp. LFM046 TaxID=1608357 RepID=UPI0005CFBDC7|nr:hypothetical protein [Pseudomonas sp. LFM046]